MPGKRLPKKAGINSFLGARAASIFTVAAAAEPGISISLPTNTSPAKPRVDSSFYRLRETFTTSLPNAAQDRMCKHSSAEESGIPFTHR